MTDGGTVEQVALARWGARIPRSIERFAKPGWIYGEPVARPCPRCAGVLHSLRKPFERGGRQYRYVALVCPVCPNAFTLADLGLKIYNEVLGNAAAVVPAQAHEVPAQAAQHEAILRFWRSVELFDAQALDPPDPQNRRYAVRTDGPLPWQRQHPLQRRPPGPELVWQHTVYGGIFSLDRVHATLQEVFGSSPEDVDERTPRGQSALFAVQVTEDGRLLLDSLVLSSAAWAVGRSRRPGPASAAWLDGFEVDARQHAERVCEVVAAANDSVVTTASAEQGDPVSRPVDHEVLNALVALTAEHLRVGEALRPTGLHVHSQPVRRDRAPDCQPDFLNSFFATDLNLVADAVARGDYGHALRDYLSHDEVVASLPRVNVREEGSENAVMEHLEPKRVPAGRWPANLEHPLASSQQLAINVIMERLGDRAGAFAVNGPPGTGKTTLLRDLIAASVVERGRHLARLPSAAAAFSGSALGWHSGKYQRRIRPLRAELTGHEMVVASANNGAVANVTREIPRLDAIHDGMRDEATYLRQHASRVLGEPAWGLIAAALGNKGNRSQFVSRFWYGQPADADSTSGEEGAGFLDWLKQAEASGGPPWRTAVAEFDKAAGAEQRSRLLRQRAHQALRSLPDLERASDSADSSLMHNRQRKQQAEDAAHSADADAALAQQTSDAALTRRREHRTIKPGVWEMVFTFGRAIRRWHTEDERLAVTCAMAEEVAATATTTAADAHRTLGEAITAVAAATTLCQETARRLADARTDLAHAYSVCGDQVPDAAWLTSGTHRELKAPWLDERWNQDRTNVFLAALRLHEAFLAGAAKIMKENLRAAMDVLAGQAPADAPEAAVRAAWQSLFLAVPVVSTTFASVSRLLRPLGRESLGWLLVDEAGQVAPQLAAGAIWRAKRLVAVGDPLQLEPVVTVLHTTQQSLRRHHGVAETWLPGCTSVQGLTDRITPIGTHLPGPDGVQVWVGAPLRVHRRCDNPMFHVVNTAVYDHLMIHGRTVRERPLKVVDSLWIDVRASDADGHWIPEEGRVVEQILKYLEREGLSPSQIMAVTPFRHAAQRLRKVTGRYPGLTSGTVHVAQGKEADVVLLVLGGDPSRPGARAWAARRPNLLNVAVSRAKQRLYVVGNHAGWADLPYFRTLANALPARPCRTARDADLVASDHARDAPSKGLR